MECGRRCRFRARLTRQLDVTVRWIMASLLEGVLGLGIGTALLLPISAPHQIFTTATLLGASIMLGIMATIVAMAHSLMMRPCIVRWRHWSLIDGSEIVLHWMIVTGIVVGVGYFPGLIALASLLSGSVIAALQSRILAQQTAGTWRWMLGSAWAWVVAGIIAATAEQMLRAPTVSTLWSVAIGRVVYGFCSGPILGWVVTRQP